MRQGKILIVEDDETLRRVMQAHLAKRGYVTATAPDAVEALKIMEGEFCDLVISDLKLPGISGLELLKKIRVQYPETEVVMVTAFGTIVTAVEAMRSGAYDYITKPLHLHELDAFVDRVLDRGGSLNELRVLHRTLDEHNRFENVIGRSEAFLKVLVRVARVARSDATVLIQGETGTGKEVLAKAIHLNSLRRERPLVTINCAAIPVELLESELFGYVRGAFTGAVTHKKGKVEIADGGTLFLDEIGELPLELQVRVLRLIQEREIEKVGSTHPIRVDVRIIAATNRDLKALVHSGGFREDLYYRLAVIPIELPPLRERPEDIPEFVRYFFEASKQKHRRPDLTLPPHIIPYFCAYHWPGNIRQLQHAIEHIVVLCGKDQVIVGDLPPFLRPPRHPSALTPAASSEGVNLEAVQRDLIVQALRRFNWNQSRAAKYLGITRKTLLYRIAKYGIAKGSDAVPAAEMARSATRGNA